MILRRTPQKSSILSRWDYQAENPLAAFKALCEKCIWGDFPLLFEYKEGSFKKARKKYLKEFGIKGNKQFTSRFPSWWFKSLTIDQKLISFVNLSENQFVV